MHFIMSLYPQLYLRPVAIQYLLEIKFLETLEQKRLCFIKLINLEMRFLNNPNIEAIFIKDEDILPFKFGKQKSSLKDFGIMNPYYKFLYQKIKFKVSKTKIPMMIFKKEFFLINMFMRCRLAIVNVKFHMMT